ncbi:MAG TPA: methyltransferase domain-containing protein [Burkholderiales bacterium]|jgi:tRNA (guanine-N7-)-methyltransferase
MHANSRTVESLQQAPHPQLGTLVLRHARHPWQKPPAPYSVAAFARLLAAWDKRTPLLLDAGCGTGASTVALAQLYPEHLAIGIDQSAARLTQGENARRGASAPENLLLLRADVVDLWSLMARERIHLARHYLLYPNPWPKPPQVMRRWPAHPAFPLLLSLGGMLECRSNWRVYVEEFSHAVGLLRGQVPAVTSFTPDEPLTPFERKYRDSGHALWRAAIDLDAGSSPAAP